MSKGCATILLGICIIAIGIMAFFLGKRTDSKTIDSIILNNTFIQEIAELSSLEAQGTTNFKSTNIINDGSLSDEIKKLFIEQTVNISIPYIAKYGVDLNKQQLTIEEKNKQVYIVLPTPKLLSYELRMNKSTAILRKGFLQNSNESLYNQVEKKLYTDSRKQLEKYPAYIQKSKDKIRNLLTSYYAPMQLKVTVTFKDEIKSRITEARD